MIGFLFLHLLFIQRGRLEIVWDVIHKFGYGTDLLLKENYLYPTLEIPADSIVELTLKGVRFFVNLFRKFDKVTFSAGKNA